MRRLYDLLVNNVREHFMIYLALYGCAADRLIHDGFLRFQGPGSQLRVQAAARFVEDLIAVFSSGA